MQRRWQLAALVLLVGTGLAVAGCGAESGDSPSDSPEGESTATSTDSRAGPQAKRPENTDVVLHTSMGEVTIRLDRENAPLTVDNFLTYVVEHYYDGTIFHQVIDGYVLVGGGYTVAMEEKPTRTAVRNEAHNGLKNLRGTIAMARSPDVIDSATCQFYINLVDNPHLDHQGRSNSEYGYCVFGKVIAGLDVLDRISKVDVQDTDEFEKLPTKRVVIESIRLIR